MPLTTALKLSARYLVCFVGMYGSMLFLSVFVAHRFNRIVEDQYYFALIHIPFAASGAWALVFLDKRPRKKSARIWCSVEASRFLLITGLCGVPSVFLPTTDGSYSDILVLQEWITVFPGFLLWLVLRFTYYSREVF